MALYHCKIGTEQGEVLSRSILAEGLDEVRREVERKGQFLLSVRRNWLTAMFSPRAMMTRRAVREQEFLVYNQQFAALLRSGLPILRALDVIVDKMRPGFFHETLADIREQIKSGRSLSEAFLEKKNLFPPIYSASLLAGERSGNMDAVLRRFMSYQHQSLSARRKIRGALIYPAVLLVLSACLATLMTVFVIPKFAATFQENEASLPLITILLMSTATTIREHVAAFAGGLLGAFLLVQAWARSDAGRLSIDRMKFRVPILGRIWHEFSIGQYARTLSTLLAGGIPVVDAMEVAAGAISNRYLSREVRASVRLVREGEPVSKALESTGLFTGISIEMVQVGETTGSLDTLLGELAAFYDERIDAQLSTLLALIEPVVLVIMGAIIATLLLSIYLPLFSLSSIVR